MMTFSMLVDLTMSLIEENKHLKADKEALIAGQETLQKYLAIIEANGISVEKYKNSINCLEKACDELKEALKKKDDELKAVTKRAAMWHREAESNAAEIIKLQAEIENHNVEVNKMVAEREALIAGQETLQKAFAEKNAEVERMKVELSARMELEKIAKAEFTLLSAYFQVKSVRAEAIKEFWSRLQGIAYRSEVEWSHGEHPMLIELDDAEEIYEEMVGDTE
jgi:chromosome segregation ATPase